MLAEVNYLAVVAAALATMVIGGLWYGPLFGRLWLRAHGYSPEQLEEMKKGMGRAYVLSFVCYLVLATVLALAVATVGAVNAWVGFGIAFYCWLGFAATIGLTSYLFSDRKLSTYLLDAGYQLVFFLVMGLILGAWR